VQVVRLHHYSCHILNIQLPTFIEKGYDLVSHQSVHPLIITEKRLKHVNMRLSFKSMDTMKSNKSDHQVDQLLGSKFRRRRFFDVMHVYFFLLY
jgi:hypothetical protein